MSTNLELSLRMAFNGSAVTTALSQMGTQLLTVGGTGRQTFNALTGSAKAFNDALGGLDGLDKINKTFGSPISMKGMKAVIDDNLAFDRSLQKIRFNTNLGTEALAEMKKTALDVSKSTLTSPQKVLEIEERLADAKISVPNIQALTPTIAAAAHVSGAAPAEVADLVAEMVNKFGIAIEDVPKMLNLLYANGQDGGLGLSSLGKQSPALFNVGAGAGITGEKGLSLMTAMTQRLMKGVANNDPGKAADLTKKGLSSITDPATVKKLGAMGIDVKSYVDDKGQFKGVGGVDGFLGLSLVMKARGLDNSAKMTKAGISDPDAATFWREMMNAANANGTEEDPSLDSAMEANTLRGNSGKLEENMAVSRNSDSGKFAGAQIALENAKLSGPASAVTSLAASTVEWAGNNMKATAMLAVAAGLIRNKLTEKKGGGEPASGAGGASAVQKVFVTNFPTSMLSRKERSERNRAPVPGNGNGGLPPGSPPGPPARIPAKARFIAGAKTGLKFGAPMAIGLGLIQALDTANDGTMTKEAKATEYKRIAGGTAGSVAGGVIGGAVGALFGGVGAVPGAMIGSAIGNWGGEKIAAMFEDNKAMIDKAVNTPVKVEVTVGVDNTGNIVGAVNTAQDKKALRH